MITRESEYIYFYNYKYFKWLVIMFKITSFEIVFTTCRIVNFYPSFNSNSCAGYVHGKVIRYREVVSFTKTLKAGKRNILFEDRKLLSLQIG